MGVALLAAAAALGTWAGVGGSSSPTPTQAAQLARQAEQAALARGSFHYVVTSTEAGTGQSIVGDAARNQGRQVITAAGDTFDVRVVGQGCWFEGDTTAMVENLGLSATQAQPHSGQWISLATTDAPYQSVYAAVTTTSALSDNITFTPKMETAETTVAGQRVIGIQGPLTGIQGIAAQGTGVLYVTAGGRHLPVRYVEHGSIGSGSSTSTLSFAMDFSAWGESVSVAEPPGAVAFSTFGTPAGTPGTFPGTTIIA